MTALTLYILGIPASLYTLYYLFFEFNFEELQQKLEEKGENEEEKRDIRYRYREILWELDKVRATPGQSIMIFTLIAFFSWGSCLFFLWILINLKREL